MRALSQTIHLADVHYKSFISLNTPHPWLGIHFDDHSNPNNSRIQVFNRIVFLAPRVPINIKYDDKTSGKSLLNSAVFNFKSISVLLLGNLVSSTLIWGYAFSNSLVALSQYSSFTGPSEETQNLIVAGSNFWVLALMLPTGNSPMRPFQAANRGKFQRLPDQGPFGAGQGDVKNRPSQHRRCR
jgi:hypothetical protein